MLVAKDVWKLFVRQPPVAILGAPGQEFYECSVCGCYHPLAWTGDCRDDENRFTTEQLDDLFPDWVEVDNYEGDD